VPRRGVTTLCAVEGNGLVQLDQLPRIPPEATLAAAPFLRLGSPAKKMVAHDWKSGWIVSVDPMEDILRLFHRDDPSQAFAPLHTPPGCRVHTIAFYRSVLFVGGSGDHPGRSEPVAMLGLFDFREDPPAWKRITVPEEVLWHENTIDDLLFDSDRLIAVDDIVYPKWLLVYDVSTPQAPGLVSVCPLPSHAVHERIASGSLGANWLALLSFDGRLDGYPVVSLLDRRTLQEYGFFVGIKGPGLQPLPWQSVTLRDDLLLIAAGENGIGVLELPGLPWPAEPLPVGYSDDPGVRAQERAFLEACARQLRYYDPLPNHAVHRLFLVPDTGQVLAAVSSQAGYDTAVLEGFEVHSPQVVG
jgi:hypothetical protein